ncbi:hypothetical protein LJR219_003144 [Phenylobacterium sp. LjRoot219]|uniref:hypothetical protein n=1 Tax=Phenylobacterium sp. LjRoot219 TaxID=3342283 RepID=UPI003ECCE2E3
MSRLTQRPTVLGRYRLRLRDATGLFLRNEETQADNDELALGAAIRRLNEAASVEVWRSARWVGQVERTRARAEASAPIQLHRFVGAA